jgi:hypothetical protein
MPEGLTPAPPDNIRPGELGVVMLGGVIIGDVAATLVDLAVRGMLAVEETGQDAQDGQTRWALRGQSTGHQLDALLPYERQLLDAVAGDGQPVTIESLAPRMPDVLNSVRHAIVHDAVAKGWLHRFHHDQRTESGEQLAARIRRFQGDLRRYATGQGEASLEGRLLPYALHFGMVRRDQLPLARFAHGWVAAFAGLPGWHQPTPARSSSDEPDAAGGPSIDEQMMSTDVSAMLWVSGGSI